MLLVIKEYPKQALWLFVSVVKSTKTQRSQRGQQILDKLKVVMTTYFSLQSLMRNLEREYEQSSWPHFV